MVYKNFVSTNEICHWPKLMYPLISETSYPHTYPLHKDILLTTQNLGSGKIIQLTTSIAHTIYLIYLPTLKNKHQSKT